MIDQTKVTGHDHYSEFICSRSDMLSKEQPFKRAGQIKCASVHSWHVTVGRKEEKTSRKLLFYAAPDTTDSKTAERNIHGVEMRHIAFGAPISLKQNVFFLNIPAFFPFSALTLVTIQ